MGSFLKNCEGDLVCKSTNEKVPYFNAPIFLENKSQIGKVDDIFGSITDRVRYSSFIRSSFISRKDARRWFWSSYLHDMLIAFKLYVLN